MNRFLKSTTALMTAASMVLTSPAMTLAQAANLDVNFTVDQLADLSLEELKDLQVLVRQDSTLSEAEKAEKLEAIKAELKDTRKAEKKAERQAEKKAERQAAKAAEQAQTQPAPQADTQAQTNTQVEGGAQVQTDTQTQAATQQPAPVTPPPAPAAQQPAPTTPPVTAQTQTQTDTQVNTTAQTETTTQDPAAAQKAEMEEQKRAERKAQRKAERQAARQAARAEGNVLPADAQAQADAAAEQQQQAAQVEANSQTQGEVTTETVTENEVRQADQEFATAPVATEKKGLSNLEKAAILGLGALAVGQLLKNGDKVVSNSGDRVIVETDDGYRVLKDDDVLLRQPGAQVKTETFSDGSTRTRVINQDGSQVVTIRAADGRVLRRTKVLADGREVRLFDDTQVRPPVVVSQLPQVNRNTFEYNDSVSASDLQAAMLATGSNPYSHSFSLAQVRNIDAVRRLVPEIAVENLRFNTGSAAIRPEQAQNLAALGAAIRSAIQANPAEVFLVEGHTDAIGSAEMNLALSDRRAETVALALSQYFQVPPENLVVQGYGEADLKVPTYTAEEANRRVAVRRITPLLN